MKWQKSKAHVKLMETIFFLFIFKLTSFELKSVLITTIESDDNEHEKKKERNENGRKCVWGCIFPYIKMEKSARSQTETETV